MRDLDIRRAILLSLAVMFFIIVTVALFYSLYAKFLFLPTGITEGTLIRVSFTGRYGSDVFYSYTVDGKGYEYYTQLVFQFNFTRTPFYVRYLLENPSDSVIDEQIPRGTFLGLALCFVEVYGMIYFFIGVIGKLPKKWQEDFDKRMAK
jgi:hypothetical protein